MGGLLRLAERFPRSCAEPHQLFACLPGGSSVYLGLGPVRWPKLPNNFSKSHTSIGESLLALLQDKFLFHGRQYSGPLMLSQKEWCAEGAPLGIRQ